MNSFRLAAPGPAFTLIELLVVLALFLVAVLVAAPSLGDMMHGTRLRLEATRVLAALNLARAEAVARRAPVSVCPAAPSSTPRCGEDYRNGWLVFSDADRNTEFGPASGDRLLRDFAALPEGYRALDRSGQEPVSARLTYLPDGSSRRNLTYLLCPPAAVAVRGWSVVLSRVGRARLSRRWGTCPGV